MIKTILSVLLLAMFAGVALAHDPQTSADPISGEWDVAFKLEGTTTPAQFNLKLEGERVSGTVYSEHTGAGTIHEGKFADNKLSLTLDFAHHQSIIITGALKDNGLSGEFRTEGFVANWEAKRTASKTAAPGATSPSDPITGDWDANFELGGQIVPVKLKLKLEGAIVSGSSNAAQANGVLSDGSWADNKIQFTMPGPHGPVHVKGALVDHSLGGTFEMGEFNGTWNAKRP
jgi:hypothetical protein